VSLFNIILRKCHVKALELEEDLNLPLHVQMPSLQRNAFDKKENSPEEEISKGED